MNIIAFEVRQDEIPSFEKFQFRKDISLKLSTEKLTRQTIHQTKGAEGVSILGKSRLDATMLDQLQANGVKYLTTRTAGHNHIDTAHAHAIGLKVSNVSYSPHGVAEYTLMLILMCLRKYKQALFRANVNDYSLSGLEGSELHNLTVGVIGAGDIGQTVIQCLGGFGCRILVHARTPGKLEITQAEFVNLDKLYEESDIISLHVPLTDETRYMINEPALSRMKQGVILINTARGELMDVEALIRGIESQKIGALGLDVFEKEDGIFHQDRRNDIINNRDMAYIRQFPNVTMTQHMAFYTHEAVESMVKNGIDNLLALSLGNCASEL